MNFIKPNPQYKPDTALGKRGKTLEKMINLTNDVYRELGLAVVTQIPVPWVIQRQEGIIISAKPQSKSTVDYIGFSKEIGGIAFDAKETTYPYWDRHHLKQHQYDFLRATHEQGAIAGVILALWYYNRFFFIPIEKIKDHARWTIDNVQEKGFEIFEKPGLVLDYLGALILFNQITDRSRPLL